MNPVFLRRFSDAVDALNERLGRVLGYLAGLMVLVALAVVILRYLFGIGFVWMQELYVWMHGLLFTLGAGYALKWDRHVRVDIFYARMSPRRRAMVDLGGVCLCLLPMTAVVLAMAWPYVSDSWSKGEESFQAGGLPGLYLLKTAILAFAVLTALQGLALAARSLLVLSGAQGSGADHGGR